MKRQHPITKPYRVPLQVDNKPLVTWTGKKTVAIVQRLDQPLNDTGYSYQRNPFSVCGFGFSEMMLMKTVLREYPQAQVLEIKEFASYEI